MRVFTQLMMKRFHSAKNYMDLSVVGSPTISSGVVSNFSTSNYLKTQIPFAPDNSAFEMLWKVKTPSSYNSHRNWIIANPENSLDYKGIAFGCNTNGDLSLYLSSTGASWNITASGNIVNLATDTDYWLKLKYDLSKYVVLVSTDGTNYTQVLSVSSSERIYASNHCIGTNGYAFGQFWGGSIDLNNSYIKIGSTKYNFQFALPLTVVGSPTITDGVVSGFTTNNYLKSNDLTFPSDWEFVVDLDLSNFTTDTNYYAFGCFGRSFLFAIKKTSASTYALHLYLSSNNSSWNIADEISSINYNEGQIYIKVKFDTTKYVLSYSANNNSWTDVITKVSSTQIYQTSIYVTIGKWSGTTTAYPSSINLNNSYLVNNGTKYIFTV